jgi:hypothetical protein
MTSPRLAVLPLLALGLTSGLAACGSEDDGPPPRATWYQDVAPLLANRCNSCHTAGGIGPFPLDDYETARANSARMIQQIEIGAMPPFDAREEADCTPRFGWVDDPRLTPDEKATIAAWAEDGHQLGEVAELPKPKSNELANISKSLVPVEGFVTSGTKDQFICYVLDPGVTQPVAWLTGLQVRPDPRWWPAPSKMRSSASAASASRSIAARRRRRATSWCTSGRRAISRCRRIRTSRCR